MVSIPGLPGTYTAVTPAGKPVTFTAVTAPKIWYTILLILVLTQVVGVLEPENKEIVASGVTVMVPDCIAGNWQWKWRLPPADLGTPEDQTHCHHHAGEPLI